LITFEYTLIKKLNDQPEHAAQLIQLLRQLPCKINLIPLSPVEGFDGERPDDRTSLSFLDTLIKAGFNTTLRKSRGKEVDAACGQLRLRTIKGE
jgi:23S rRNA (adenine2503-C2)-methyltransferase